MKKIVISFFVLIILTAISQADKPPRPKGWEDSDKTDKTGFKITINTATTTAPNTSYFTLKYKKLDLVPWVFQGKDAGKLLVLVRVRANEKNQKAKYPLCEEAIKNWTQKPVYSVFNCSENNMNYVYAITREGLSIGEEQAKQKAIAQGKKLLAEHLEINANELEKKEFAFIDSKKEAAQDYLFVLGSWDKNIPVTESEPKIGNEVPPREEAMKNFMRDLPNGLATAKAGVESIRNLKKILKTNSVPDLNTENSFLIGNEYFGICSAPGSLLSHNNVPEWLKSPDGKFTAVIMKGEKRGKTIWYSLGTGSNISQANQKAQEQLKLLLDLPEDASASMAWEKNSKLGNEVWTLWSYTEPKK